jgi:glutathione S-transferase
MLPAMVDPETLTLYGFGGYAGLADLSPFVAKLEAWLKLADVAYDKRPGDARKAPRGKLPFVVHRGQKISDSQRILEHFAATGVGDLDATLDADQRAELFALRSLLELDFYFVLVFFRWQYEPGWARYREGIGAVVRKAGVPGFLLGPVLGLIRKNALEQVFAQGTGRREVEENLEHARSLFASLEWLLRQREGGRYWFGEQPTSADAIAHAFVSAAVVPKVDSPLAGLLEPHPRLQAWFEAVDPICRADLPGAAA